MVKAYKHLTMRNNHYSGVLWICAVKIVEKGMKLWTLNTINNKKEGKWKKKIWRREEISKRNLFWHLFNRFRINDAHWCSYFFRFRIFFPTSYFVYDELLVFRLFFSNKSERREHFWIPIKKMKSIENIALKC